MSSSTHYKSGGDYRSTGKSYAPINDVAKDYAFGPVKSDHVPFIIGKKGATIRNIIAISGAFVKVQKPDADNGRPEPWFLVRGQSHQVGVAMDMLNNIRSEAVARSVESEAKEAFEVAEEDVGFIIGSGGRTVKGVKTRTGARVQIQKPNDIHPTSWFLVSGRVSQVDAAMKELETIRTRAQQKRGVRLQSVEMGYYPATEYTSGREESQAPPSPSYSPKSPLYSGNTPPPVAKWEKTTLGNGDGTGDWAEDQKIGETNAVVA